MELGIYTFAERTPDLATGETIGFGPRLRNLIEEIRLADRVGLDVFGVGEHHRADFSVSAPAVVLGAATVTERIRLTSAVSVISSDDPIRVFQDFATVDLSRAGAPRSWRGAGRSSSRSRCSATTCAPTTSCSPRSWCCCCGCASRRCCTGRAVEHTPPVDGRGVYPRPEQEPLPVWVAVGGTPQSVARAGALHLPLAIAFIGGQPARFRSLVELHREAARATGHPDPEAIPIGINVHGFVADTTQEAADVFYGPFAHTMTQIGKERGWGPTTRQGYEAMRSPQGALAVGSPDEVAEKILHWHRIFGMTVAIEMSVGTMPHDALLRSIELFGTEVAPRVRAEVARRAEAGDRAGVTGPA